MIGIIMTSSFEIWKLLLMSKHHDFRHPDPSMNPISDVDPRDILIYPESVWKECDGARGQGGQKWTDGSEIKLVIGTPHIYYLS